MSIKEGTNVIIVDNSSNRRVLRIKHGKTIKHVKVMIDMGQLIGTEFGAHYLVVDPKSGELERIDDVKQLTKAFLDDTPIGVDPDENQEEDGEEEEEKEIPGDGVHNKDNRDIVDNNLAQKLTHAEITELKQQGITGQKMIDKIIQGSETFSKRTKFS